jgi:hypothetical protein
MILKGTAYTSTQQSMEGKQIQKPGFNDSRGQKWV